MRHFVTFRGPNVSNSHESSTDPKKVEHIPEFGIVVLSLDIWQAHFQMEDDGLRLLMPATFNIS